MNSFNEDSKEVIENPSLSEPPHLRSFIPESTLCGYLGKLSSQQKSLSQLLANTAGKGFVKSLTRQRWIVFSEHTCKLFYFKEKGSTECLGEINIAGATFNYDPEDSDGLFTIMSGGEIHYFTARNDASRQAWLESLQEGKVRFINRCQEGEGAPTRIQWYTSLPSSPPPELGRFNITNVLHSTSGKVALRNLYSSAKKLSSTGASSNHTALSDQRSSPAQLGNRTLSHEDLTFGNPQVTLRKNRPSPKRPTSIHFSNKCGSHNDDRNSNCIGYRDLEHLQNSENNYSFSNTQLNNSHIEGYRASVPASPETENKPALLRSNNTSRSFRSHFSPLKTGLKSGTKWSKANDRSHRAEPEVASPTHSLQTNISPSPSVESFTGLRQIGADFKASLSKYSLQRSSKRSSAETTAVDSWLEAEEGGCANCVQLRRALAAVEERLDTRDEELKAAKEGIVLLQQDLALFHRQRQTSSQLDERNCSDEHLLAILRGKDQSLVEFEQSDCLQKNEIAELKQKSQRLGEQVDLLTTLVKAKDNAIRSISDELEELKARCSIISSPLTGKNAHPVQLSSGIHNFLVSSQKSNNGAMLEVRATDTDVLAADRGHHLNQGIEEVAHRSMASTLSGNQSAQENILAGKPVAKFVYQQNSSVSSDSDLLLPYKDQVQMIGQRRRKSTDSASTDSEPYSSCFELTAGFSDNVSPTKTECQSETHNHHVTNSSPTSDNFKVWTDLHSTGEELISNIVHESLNNGDPVDDQLGASNARTLKSHCNENSSTKDKSDALGLQKNTLVMSHDKPASVTLSYSGALFTQKHSLNTVAVAPHRSGAKDDTLTEQSDQRIRLSDLSLADDVMMSSTGTDSLSVMLDHSDICDPADQEMNLERVSNERDRYQESYRAYKAQNSFLHKQILELSQASDLMKEREERLKHECSVWEARFERVRSKYLVLLNDLHSPPSQQHDKDTLARMLSDALSHTPHFGSVTRHHVSLLLYSSTLRAAVSKNGRYYDECGFCITAADEDSLQRCATFLSRQAQTNVGEELQQVRGAATRGCGHDCCIEVKQTTTAWEAALAGASGVAPSLQMSLLKPLIRKRGLPLHFRPRVWKLLVDNHVGSLRRQFPETYYEDLLARCIIRPSDDTSSEYVDLKTKKQVELDLLRTLPNNRFYENEYADNIIRLRRVLLAFAVHNREVSYCQLCEEGIMARTEFMEVSNYLRSVPTPLGNVDKLKQVSAASGN
ncbi:Pleckstrin domain [Trinorchestia longiramus]|nr:Pleckstrin domain [Trinorchestia longiramus]